MSQRHERRRRRRILDELRETWHQCEPYALRRATELALVEMIAGRRPKKAKRSNVSRKHTDRTTPND